MCFTLYRMKHLSWTFHNIEIFKNLTSIRFYFEGKFLSFGIWPTVMCASSLVYKKSPLQSLIKIVSGFDRTVFKFNIDIPIIYIT